MGDLTYHSGEPEFPRWLRRYRDRELFEYLTEEHKALARKELRAAHAIAMHKRAVVWLLDSARETLELSEVNEDNPLAKTVLIEEHERFRRQLGRELDT